MQLIDGHKIAGQIKDGIVGDILEMNQQDRDLSKAKAEAQHRPNLAIILVGGREDSHIYVNLKEKEAKKVGVDTHLYKCEENITEEEVVEMIRYLNNDPQVDGIFVQLPLPSHLDTDKIVATVDPAKDVDRFHPDNIKQLHNTGEEMDELILPPVFRVISAVLDHINYDITGASVAVLANADVFKDNLSVFLRKKGASSVRIIGPENPQWGETTSQADLLITAVGKPGIIDKSKIKQEAVVIDVGISRGEDGKVHGDVDQESAAEKAGYLTPVPGGVGPMTVAATLENVTRMYNSRIRKW